MTRNTFHMHSTNRVFGGDRDAYVGLALGIQLQRFGHQRLCRHPTTKQPLLSVNTVRDPKRVTMSLVSRAAIIVYSTS